MINPSSSCFHQTLVISHSWPTQARFVSDLSFTDAERPRKGEQEHFTRTRPWPLSKTRKKEKKNPLLYFPFVCQSVFYFHRECVNIQFHGKRLPTREVTNDSFFLQMRLWTFTHTSWLFFTQRHKKENHSFDCCGNNVLKALCNSSHLRDEESP